MIDRLKQTKAGFTLVELIVVIAILAILAGIAIPTYSGYIKKANEAGDLQLLSAVNTAFSAACAEIGVNPTQITATAALTGSTGAKKIQSVTATGSEGAVSGFHEVFTKYFAGNEDSTFKNIETLQYVQPEGVFVGYTAGETVTYTYTDSNGNTVTLSISADALSAFQNSAFDTIVSTRGLMKSVDDVTKAAAGSVTLSTRLQNKNGLKNKFGQDYVDYLQNVLNMSDDDLAALAADSSKVANSLVLYTAYSYTNSGLGIEELLASNSSGLVNIAQLGTTKADVASQAALRYALEMAYCYSNPDATLTVPNGEPVGSFSESDFANSGYSSIYEYIQDTYGDGKAIMDMNGTFTVYNGVEVNALEAFTSEDMLASPVKLTLNNGLFFRDEEFQNYLNSDQALADLGGFLGAMSMASDNVSNVGLDNLLSQGYYSEDFVAMLESVLGP